MFGGGTSLQLFRIFGFRVGVHWSWFLILFLWIIWLKDSLDDAIIGTGQGFLAAVISAALFFGSIVAHELGHAFAARREGIGVGGIELFFFGGFMRADRDSQTAGEEFRVAAAGPAVTLALAIVFGVDAYATLGDALRRRGDAELRLGLDDRGAARPSPRWPTPPSSLLNIVPAFPLDGGRILRAIVWQLTGDRHKATHVLGLPRPGLRGADDGLRRLPPASATRPTASPASGGSCSAGCSAARPARRSPRARS